MRLKVAVVGAGIVGLCCAHEIQKAGHDVVLIEPEVPGGPHSASYGNAAWINPGGIMPTSYPGLWRQVPQMLFDRMGPLSVRWRYIPKVWRWLLRFLWSARNWDQVRHIVEARFPLCRSAVNDYGRLSQDIGRPDLFLANGLTYVYRDREGYLAEGRTWQSRARLGVAFTELPEPELRALYPDLGSDYRFGVRIDGGAHLCDPGAFCTAIFAALKEQGAQHLTAKVTGFAVDQGRLMAVLTDGEAVSCDKAILAAGIGSAFLAKGLGDAVPLASERGYHIQIREPGVSIVSGMMPSDGKMGVISTPSGLRFAGQVEIASPEASPDWRRCEILLDFAKRMFPGLKGRTEMHAGGVGRWLGDRPSTPDSIPCIGPARRCRDVIYAFGHGHSGVTQAPATAKIVSQMLTSYVPENEMAEYSPRRFV